MDYHAAIQHLDSLPTADQARAYVTADLSQRYDWSRKEEHVNKLAEARRAQVCLACPASLRLPVIGPRAA